MDKIDNFKEELHELLKKYNASISCNVDGDTHGLSYEAVSIGGENLKSITWTLNKMLECRTKPIIWAGEKFPNECKIKYTCDLCGRDTFDKPSPHKCSGGFRKRGLRWSLNYR